MTWVRGIDARSLRHLERVDVDLRPTDGGERMHLVLVGPNGSGKTSLLEGIAREIGAAIDGRPHPAAAAEETRTDPERRDREVRMAHVGRPVRLTWSDERAVRDGFASGSAIFAHVAAPRRLSFAAADKPTPSDTDPRRPDAQVADRLPQLLRNRETEAQLARQSGDRLRAKVHEAWLLRVQSALRTLLHQPRLELKSDRGAFHIDLPDGRRMAFDELSRGHASAVAIWAEVMMRVEATRLRSDDPQLDPSGVVVIDAAEADLDTRLQRELLPALSLLFPRIQLVVSTHSPLVAMSLDHAVVYDLARRRGRPSLEVRRGGVEALIVSMLGHDERAPAPIRSRPPPPPGASRSPRPAPPKPGTLRPPAAQHRPSAAPPKPPLRPSAPPPGRLPPKPRSVPPPIPEERTRRTTLGGPGPWSNDE